MMSGNIMIKLLIVLKFILTIIRIYKNISNKIALI